jgi:hypothetical protein
MRRKLIHRSISMLLAVGVAACAEGNGGEGATTGGTSRIADSADSAARAAGAGATTGATSRAADTAGKARAPYR